MQNAFVIIEIGDKRASSQSITLIREINITFYLQEIRENCMAQLYLVRHGQASFGAQDYDQLSDIGIKQAELLGQFCQEREISFDMVVTGSMKRHHQTADGILKFAQTNGKRVENTAWNEFDFESVIKAYLVRYPDLTPPKGAQRSVYYRLLKSAMQEWAQGHLVDGLPETWIEFQSRVAAATAQIQSAGSKNVLVATSGGAIAIMLMNLLGVSVQQAIDFNLQIKNTSVNHFFFSDKGYQLSTFNAVSHLDMPSRKHLITYS